MSAADKLAQVLAEHTICWNGSYGQYECTEGDAMYEAAEYCDAEVEHAAHQAAVVLAHLTAEGWAQTVAEEWGVYRPELNADRQTLLPRCPTAEKAAGGGSHVVRRRVTDWEPVDA